MKEGLERTIVSIWEKKVPQELIVCGFNSNLKWETERKWVDDFFSLGSSTGTAFCLACFDAFYTSFEKSTCYSRPLAPLPRYGSIGRPRMGSPRRIQKWCLTERLTVNGWVWKSKIKLDTL